jgi:hypothetical protein
MRLRLQEDEHAKDSERQATERLVSNRLMATAQPNLSLAHSVGKLRIEAIELLPQESFSYPPREAIQGSPAATGSPIGGALLIHLFAMDMSYPHTITG